MTDYQIKKIVKILQESPLTGYYIAQKTGLTEQTILNYRKKKTIPTNANAKLLEYFFNLHNTPNSPNQSIVGDNNVQTGNNSKITTRNYNDSLDVLYTQIDEKDKLLFEKEERIREKDAQIKEKDAQINKLLSILSNK